MFRSTISFGDNLSNLGELKSLPASDALSATFAAFDASLIASRASNPLLAALAPLAILLIFTVKTSSSSHPAASNRLASSPVRGSFPVISQYTSLTEKNSPITYGIFSKPSTIFW